MFGAVSGGEGVNDSLGVAEGKYRALPLATIVVGLRLRGADQQPHDHGGRDLGRRIRLGGPNLDHLTSRETLPGRTNAFTLR